MMPILFPCFAVLVYCVWPQPAYAGGGGFFGGFTKNMGSQDSIKSTIYARGSNIGYVYRVSPRIVYIAGKLTFGLEGEYTFVMYGKANGDNKGGVTNLYAVSNTRALLAIIYNF